MENVEISSAPVEAETIPASDETTVETTSAALAPVETKEPENVAAADAAPASLPNPHSFVTAIPGGPTQPSLDTDKFDDLGHAKDDKELAMGPRGKNLPQDSMLAEDRAVTAAAAEAAKKPLYASTAAHDSRGDQKGTFEVTPQGHDKHGARIPDVVDYSKPVEAPALHGPRGTGVPKDSFHG